MRWLALAFVPLLLSGCTAPTPQPEAALAQSLSFVTTTGVEDVFTVHVLGRHEVLMTIGFTRSSTYLDFVADGPGDCAGLSTSDSGTWSCGILEPGTYNLTLSVLAGVARGYVGVDPGTLRPA